MRPLFRALTHQTHITAIMICNNNLGNEGIKYLTDCICTLKQLTVLDLSKNNITSEGIKMLYSVFEKSTRPICQMLEDIDLCGNPINDEGFKYVLKLSLHIKFKNLKLNNCNITEHAVFEPNRSQVNFDTLEVLDMSNNALKQDFVTRLMAVLNVNIISELELDNICVDGNVVSCVATFMDRAKELKIRKFSLSNCKLVDGYFMRIFR